MGGSLFIALYTISTATVLAFTVLYCLSPGLRKLTKEIMGDPIYKPLPAAEIPQIEKPRKPTITVYSRLEPDPLNYRKTIKVYDHPLDDPFSSVSEEEINRKCHEY